jgi:RNA polymerase sigma-70 factor (ECF subfamily)
MARDDVDEIEQRLRAGMLAGLAGEAAPYRATLQELSGLLRAYYARRMGFGAADGEDLVQETLMAIHSRRATYDPAQPFTAWAYAIARYKLIDHLRRRKVRPQSALEEADELSTDGGVEDYFARMDLERVLGSLPPKVANLIRDVRITGLSTREAAAKYGLSESAVKVTVHRGLKTLGLKYGQGGEDEDG